MRAPRLIVTIGSALVLGGCASAGPQLQTAANPDHPRAEAVLEHARRPLPAREQSRELAHEPARDASAMLREGIRLYNDGEFANAIATFNAPEIQAANAATRTSALKYTAFSYCVTQRPVPCRQAFDKALRIDANFALAPGEEGHPMWGPVFDKARASR